MKWMQPNDTERQILIGCMLVPQPTQYRDILFKPSLTSESLPIEPVLEKLVWHE